MPGSAFFLWILTLVAGLVYDDRMLAHRCTWDPHHIETPLRLSRIWERCHTMGLVDRDGNFYLSEQYCSKPRTIFSRFLCWPVLILIGSGEEKIDSGSGELKNITKIFKNIQIFLLVYSRFEPRNNIVFRITSCRHKILYLFIQFSLIKIILQKFAGAGVT